MCVRLPGTQQLASIRNINWRSPLWCAKKNRPPQNFSHLPWLETHFFSLVFPIYWFPIWGWNINKKNDEGTFPWSWRNQHEPPCIEKESKEPPHYWTFFFCLMFKCNANRLWLYINILEKKGLCLFEVGKTQGVMTLSLFYPNTIYWTSAVLLPNNRERTCLIWNSLPQSWKLQNYVCAGVKLIYISILIL